ncbi:P-loop containing nucleoside triphosphate hydrolase protein, partial [Mycena epipterygia]
MFASSPQNAVVSRPSSKPSLTSGPSWLEALLFNANLITAGADAFPFPYVKGIFGAVVFLLEAVQKVRQNQESMKELCGDTVDIITVLQNQISAHGDTAALKFKTQCEELEVFLQVVLQTVNQLQMRPQGFGARFKEIIKASNTVDEISRFRTRMQELRSNFMLMATMDTNFQVQKVLTVISPDMPVVQVLQQINNCSPSSKIFHGRQIILQKMHQYFTQTTGKQDIFLLHGLGGAGKTQIALKFIAQSTSNFTDIFFIDSSSIETIETGLINIAKTKAVGESSQDALQWLQSKQDEWLLFFDNADDPKINLNDYFPQCDHGNIIITSRNPGLVVHASAHSVISDMEEIDAVDLLLRSAGEEATDDKKTAAVQIVKVLHYLPLAIVQAGAFISKSGDLDSYQALYEQNQARLLSQKPAQSHDNYAWTIYTTWQISFNQLSPPAAMFLQLCSLLRHQGISEQIFKNAATYKFGPSSPSKEELQMPLKYLSQFLGPDGAWDSFCFMDMTNEIRAYSLINFSPQQKMFSIHPLVHDWTRSTLSVKQSYHHCMVAMVGMSLAGLPAREIQLVRLWIQSHIDFLLQDNSNIIPDFRQEYGKIYMWGEKLQKAEKLQLAVFKKQRNILGEDHQDTLQAMFWLAWTYRKLGKFKEAEKLEVVVLKWRRNTLGDNHPDTLDSMGALAVTYITLGKLKEAEELEVVVLKQQRNVLGDNHPDTLDVMGNLAATYQHLGKLKEAEELE